MFKWLGRLFSFTDARTEVKVSSSVKPNTETYQYKSSLVYKVNGKTVYEEKDGEVIKGDAKGKQEAEEVLKQTGKDVEDAINAAEKAINETSKSIHNLFFDINKLNDKIGKKYNWPK